MVPLSTKKNHLSKHISMKSGSIFLEKGEINLKDVYCGQWLVM